jgi:GNAT superfamily N-acetyltransferase
VVVRVITAEAARPLRQAVLRPGLPPETTHYPGDEQPGAWHAGAYQGEMLIGIASVYPEAPPGEGAAGAWRLRGMAVRPECQGQGVGQALVEACAAHARAAGGTLMWCNGRVSALGFYRRVGFEPAGEVFDLPHSGPHYLLRRVLG